MWFIVNNRPTDCNTSDFLEIIFKILKIFVFVMFYKISEPGV